MTLLSSRAGEWAARRSTRAAGLTWIRDCGPETISIAQSVRRRPVSRTDQPCQPVCGSACDRIASSCSRSFTTWSLQ
jgi:hypothetical protein